MDATLPESSADVGGDPAYWLQPAGGARPSYLTYPASNRFIEAFGPRQLQQALRHRAASVVPVSLHVHIPFCESQCHHCACHHVITRQHNQGASYLKLLGQELVLLRARIGTAVRVNSLHLVGGSPTFLTDPELAQLLAMLRGTFVFAKGADLMIDIDPRRVDPARLGQLRSLGFDHIDLGVVDTNPAVQQAVNRVHPLSTLRDLMRASTTLAFGSIRISLLCGLPHQTPRSFGSTVAAIVEMRPTRIGVQAYDHQPQRHRSQRRIDARVLPDGVARSTMLDAARTQLAAAGYQALGSDDFALPDDALAVARRQGRLHRGLQGYTTHDCDMLGLGMSAVSRIGAHYSQNAVTLDDYRDRLAQHELPVIRGVSLTRDDLMRRSIIMALLCQGRVDFQPLAIAHLQDPRVTLAPELTQAAALAREGLLCLTEAGIELTASGQRAASTVASVFDRYTHADARHERYSHVI